ncbi:MAG TPA: hypothetical protein VJA94_05550 [Candidatus Angelobacter sp.]
MPARPLNLLVFRDGSREVSGPALKAALKQSLQLLRDSFHEREILDALLRAGELECALSDCCSRSEPFPTVTDALATALVSSTPVPNRNQLLETLDATHVPERLTLAVPEGFAYYALHPLAFAGVLDRISPLPQQALIIGIRSIGATLSAVSAAALRVRGLHAERTTIRPKGHPYNRSADLSPQQGALVKSYAAANANFLIVDEGPGLSGSSFLSVAEALTTVGVPAEKITLICSHEPQIEHLCAENAARRWRQFRSLAVCDDMRRPDLAQVWAGSGEWRKYLLREERSWPASWLTFERPKYLSEGAQARFFKFLGFGHYGSEVAQREIKIAAAGFGPVPAIEDAGFGSYDFIGGRPMCAADLSESALARLAAYCALRAQSCALDAVDLAPLQQMAEHDLQELRFNLPVKLSLEKPVICDGRMQPHEWILTSSGQMLKVDSGLHGDDHFFPGPTDIAWDLAGAIVEWQMSPHQATAFIDMYRRGSGDDPGARIHDYVVAYTVFRCAYCLMAANAMQGTREQPRLESAAADYGDRLMQLDPVRVKF